MMREADLLEMGRIAVPLGVTPTGIVSVGRNVETGGSIVVHVFTFHDKASGKTQQVRILADAGTSRAEVEDSAALALENWLVDLKEQAQRKVGKHAPSTAERREVGAAVREFRAYAAKRKASSNGRIYY